MSRVTGKPPTHWRRPITRTYDYNMSLGENYYKPQLDYIATRKGRGNTPPSATTFAERLSLLPPSRRSASATRRAEDSEIGIGIGTTSSHSAASADASLGRYASLDDLGLDDDLSTRRRRQLLLDASQENLADRGTSPFLSSAAGGRNRVTFGDKVLDAVGVREFGGSSSSLQQETKSALSSSSKKQSSTMRMSSEEGDAIDKILAERRNRRQQGILSVQTADADLFTEDPLKSPKISTRLQQARQQMDEMRDEMRKDADSSSASSRFRQRLRAKREKEMRDEQHDNFFGGSLSALNDIGSSSASSATSAARQFRSEVTSSSNAASSAARSSGASSGLKMSSISSSAQNLFADDDDSETAAILSKVEQIRKRAKARIQQINDDVDFPDLQIESSLASRRAAARSRFDDDDLSSDFRLGNASSSSSGGGRAVTISKRTLKTSYDIE